MIRASFAIARGLARLGVVVVLVLVVLVGLVIVHASAASSSASSSTASSAPELPATGALVNALVALALGLVTAGLLLVVRGRRHGDA